MNDLIRQFMREKNAQLSLGEEDYEPETADDYLELAEEENSKKKQIEYAFLFESAHSYFEWGYQALKKETAKK